MKIRFERGDVVFEYEQLPMKESRFRALCALAAAGVYVEMVWAVVTLCGFDGLIVVAVSTAILAAIVLG